MKLQKDLREFIELLNSGKIDYVIVGGPRGRLKDQADIEALVKR